MWGTSLMPDLPPITPEDIARWRELDEEATKGPWATGTYDSAGYRDVIWPEDKGVICTAWSDHATLIAEYRTAVPRLLDRVEALEANVFYWKTLAQTKSRRLTDMGYTE